MRQFAPRTIAEPLFGQRVRAAAVLQMVQRAEAEKAVDLPALVAREKLALLVLEKFIVRAHISLMGIRKAIIVGAGCPVSSDFPGDQGKRI